MQDKMMIEKLQDFAREYWWKAAIAYLIIAVFLRPTIPRPTIPLFDPAATVAATVVWFATWAFITVFIDFIWYLPSYLKKLISWISRLLK